MNFIYIARATLPFSFYAHTMNTLPSRWIFCLNGQKFMWPAQHQPDRCFRPESILHPKLAVDEDGDEYTYKKKTLLSTWVISKMLAQHWKHCNVIRKCVANKKSTNDSGVSVENSFSFILLRSALTVNAFSSLLRWLTIVSHFRKEEKQNNEKKKTFEQKTLNSLYWLFVSSHQNHLQLHIPVELSLLDYKMDDFPWAFCFSAAFFLLVENKFGIFRMFASNAF